MFNTAPLIHPLLLVEQCHGALCVQKYGGTSVGSIERIENVANKVKAFHDAGHQMVVVLSAMSGETNRLILPKPSPKTPIRVRWMPLVSTGEQVTIALWRSLCKTRHQSTLFTGWQVGIKKPTAPLKARIEDINAKPMRDVLNDGGV